MLFFELVELSFFLLSQFIFGLSVDLGMLTADLFSVEFLTHAVAAVKSFFESTVKLLLLFLLFSFKDSVDVVHTCLVLLQDFLLLCLVEG